MEERAPASFGKSLYFGHIPEPLVVPYPTLRKEERESLALIVDQFRKPRGSGSGADTDGEAAQDASGIKCADARC